VATTQQMVDEVLQDFSQSSTNMTWSTANVVAALNEAYQYLYRAIVRRDREGQFFGIEKNIVYTAAARNVSLDTLLGYKALLIHSIENVDDDYAPIQIIDRRNERLLSRRSISTTYAMLQMGKLYLTIGGAAPTAAVNLRIFYTPAPILMASSGNVTTRGGIATVWGSYEPEFIPDQYSAIVGYAVVRLMMGEQQPSQDQQLRFDQLERSVLEAAQDALQSQDYAEVLVTNTTQYEVYE